MVSSVWSSFFRPSILWDLPRCVSSPRSITRISTGTVYFSREWCYFYLQVVPVSVVSVSNRIGRICLDILKVLITFGDHQQRNCLAIPFFLDLFLQDKWSPALQIRTVLLSIQGLLSAPNPDDPLDNNVAEHWKRNEADAVIKGMLYHRVSIEYGLYDGAFCALIYIRLSCSAWMDWPIRKLDNRLHLVL